MGFRMLPNAHAVIERGSDQLIVAGVTDLSAPSASEPVPDLDLTLRGAPADTSILLLDHQPGTARDAAARGVALQLFGHTHGGMTAGLDRIIARANAGFGMVRGRRHDALRQQRHRPMAGLRAPVGRAVRDHTVHVAANVVERLVLHGFER